MLLQVRLGQEGYSVPWRGAYSEPHFPVLASSPKSFQSGELEAKCAICRHHFLFYPHLIILCFEHAACQGEVVAQACCLSAPADSYSHTEAQCRGRSS